MNDYASPANITVQWNTFTSDGWYGVRVPQPPPPEVDPPAGVREPRRPRPGAGPAAVVAVVGS